MKSIDSKRPRKANRRSEILRATEMLMRSRGLSGVTTREISRAVGCSEAALYVHFKGRLELLLAMLEESLPGMLRPLEALKKSVGRGSPQENLIRALDGIFSFHKRIVPATAGLFAEPGLLAAYRNSLKRESKGPHLSMRVLEDYIRGEQQSGRIEMHVEAELAACLMMSASFYRAFVEQFFGSKLQPAWNVFAERLVSSLVAEAAPDSKK
jgi:AcrR family transcriptional regulator